MKNNAAVPAPNKPPMSETTAENFCTLFIVRKWIWGFYQIEWHVIRVLINIKVIFITELVFSQQSASKTLTKMEKYLSE